MFEKNNFRKARKIYRETHGESQPGKTGLNDQMNEARYFIGQRSRGGLSRESVVRYFGEEYAKKHMRESRSGTYFVWVPGDSEERKTVSPEEIKNSRGRIQALARRLIEVPNPDTLLLGVQLYEILGKGKKAASKILKFAPITNREYGRPIAPYEIEFLEEFIEKHTGTKPKNLEAYLNEDKGQESRTSIFILSALAGIALIIYSSTSNPVLIGHVISNVPTLFQNSQGLLGIFLFVFGLAGLVFNFRKNI